MYVPAFIDPIGEMLPHIVLAQRWRLVARWPNGKVFHRRQNFKRSKGEMYIPCEIKHWRADFRRILTYALLCNIPHGITAGNEWVTRICSKAIIGAGALLQQAFAPAAGRRGSTKQHRIQGVPDTEHYRVGVPYRRLNERLKVGLNCQTEARRNSQRFIKQKAVQIAHRLELTDVVTHVTAVTCREGGGSV